MNKLKSIPLGNIAIRDSFWDRYLKLVREVILPYQWNTLNDKIKDVEMSHCIMNFKIAAGREKGEFYGAVFQDSDVMKWLEAVSYSLASHPDAELEEKADQVIALIEEAQQEDGYINTYFILKEPDRRFKNLSDGHELYCAGHMMEAATAYYKTTKKTKFLHIAERFADLICKEFSAPNNTTGYPGHQEIEIGLIKLYDVTGNQKYLLQARDFLLRRGAKPSYFLKEWNDKTFKAVVPEITNIDLVYSQSHIPIMEQTEAQGHAVRAVYMYCAMADVAAECEDLAMLKVCRQLWNSITQCRMYITGSIGSSGILERFTTDYDLPNNCNYSETCAAVGLALFSRRMAQITKEAHFMDVAERSLYNTILAGVAMDGQSFFYVNPLEVWPKNCIPQTSKEHVKPVRQPWFPVSCCPPNVARTLASLGEYMYFTDETNLWVNLFMSNQAKVSLKDTEVNITMKTAFPLDGKISIELSASEEMTGTLYLRIPDYVKEYEISSDAENLNKVQTEKGYLPVSLHGKTQTVTIEFSLAPYLVHANPNVREDIGKVAVMKGPVVYCMEECDNEPDLPAYYLKESEPLTQEYDANLLKGTMVIHGKGKKALASQWTKEELYSTKPLCYEERDLTFIPYAYWANRTSGEMLVWVKEYE